MVYVLCISSPLSRLLHYIRVLLYVYWTIEIIEWKKKESERAERFDKHIDLRVQVGL